MGELAGRLDVEELRREVPFEQSVLMTADGKSVKERRHGVGRQGLARSRTAES